ncbi:uncharacterized protein LOC106157429 [Lingula anatina]|uniref:Uncharacterized protein LOC106157429 n=1 Tax=Lingula anatina TaxID=7574 RepID=A0A1S3HTY2_LINAN|nr:uncharacterized protein LOC106157429 [Lingula anatina]|eukprot:XP_013388514.1 uncharacterized protein LOC106157429 [Lingula anatina]
MGRCKALYFDILEDQNEAQTRNERDRLEKFQMPDQQNGLCQPYLEQKPATSPNTGSLTNGQSVTEGAAGALVESAPEAKSSPYNLHGERKNTNKLQCSKFVYGKDSKLTHQKDSDNMLDSSDNISKDDTYLKGSVLSPDNNCTSNRTEILHVWPVSRVNPGEQLQPQPPQPPVQDPEEQPGELQHQQLPQEGINLAIPQNFHTENIPVPEEGAHQPEPQAQQHPVEYIDLHPENLSFPIQAEDDDTGQYIDLHPENMPEYSPA